MTDCVPCPGPMILIVAPGAGLGHLTRACAISIELAALGRPHRIVTPSPLAEGMARLTGCPIDFIPRAHWGTDLPDYSAALEPGLVVLDTFPWGIEGEWRGCTRFRFALLARRLLVQPYLRKIGSSWMGSSPQLSRVMIAEPLSRDHFEALAGSCPRNARRAQIVSLSAPIRFPLASPPGLLPASPVLSHPPGGAEVGSDVPSCHWPAQIGGAQAGQAVSGMGRVWKPPAIPGGLLDRLHTEHITLVVHSGPRSEIDQLLEIAQREAEKRSIVVITPRPDERLEVPSYDYFPASLLFPLAFRVVTGGGYNSVAELSGWPWKWASRGFPRYFDDQAGRLRRASSDPWWHGQSWPPRQPGRAGDLVHAHPSPGGCPASGDVGDGSHERLWSAGASQAARQLVVWARTGECLR